MRKFRLLATALVLTSVSVLPASAEAPSFNCEKATYSDERTICSSAELSQLDNVLVAGYEYVRRRYGDQYANSINAPLFQARRACATDAVCIKVRQLAAIQQFQSLGAPVNVPQVSQPQQLLWDHNGSTVYLVAKGASRQFFYKKPQAEMLSVGAKPDTLIFEGKADGATYQGTAYLFDSRCGKLPYRVSGPILDNYRRVELRGQTPRVDSSCRIIGYADGFLAFQLIEPDDSTTTPPSVGSASVPNTQSSQAVDVSRPSQSTQDAPTTDCDTHAADPFDPQRIVEGVPIEKLNPDLAISACENAVGQYPYSSRLIFQLGRAYQKKNDFNSALIQYRKAAEQGYLSAQFYLGVMYQNGQGVAQSTAKAIELWRKTADQGLASAQSVLGTMYATGSGLRQNNAEAVKWLRKAADQQLATAQVMLGKMYQTGLGVAQNNAEAAKWYRKAADQGDADAQNELGYMFAKGEGLQKNDVEAMKWFRKAADQGLSIAKDNLKRAEEESEVKKPQYGWLLTAYKRYSIVKYCNETRQGYAMVYINDVELDRARNTIKAIEADALAKNKDLDTDAIWKRANTEVAGTPIDAQRCHMVFRELITQYKTDHPEQNAVKKDF